VVNTAIANNWAVNDPSLPASQLGGSNYLQQQAILNNYGIANDVIQGYNETGIANLLQGGRGVMLSVNAGILWNDSNYNGNGSVNHAVTLTGAVHNANTGDLMGFYISDSGRGKVNDMNRFVDIDTFRKAADVNSAYSIHTRELAGKLGSFTAQLLAIAVLTTSLSDVGVPVWVIRLAIEVNAQVPW
jgi:hypothetical protein